MHHNFCPTIEAGTQRTGSDDLPTRTPGTKGALCLKLHRPQRAETSLHSTGLTIQGFQSNKDIYRHLISERTPGIVGIQTHKSPNQIQIHFVLKRVLTDYFPGVES